MQFDSYSTGGDVFAQVNEQVRRSAMVYASSSPIEPMSFARALEAVGVGIEYRDLSTTILNAGRHPPFRLSGRTVSSSTYTKPSLAVAKLSTSAASAAIERWSGLEDGWDEEGSPAPSKAQLDAGRSLLQQVEAWAIPAPTPYIAGDGEFGFRWRKGDGFASASFLPDGEILLFSRGPSASQPYRAQVEANGDLSWLAFTQQLLAFA